MKKGVGFVVVAAFIALSLGVTGWKPMTYAAGEKPVKKAILVVSFGTTFADTRKVTTDAVEAKIRKTFPDYEVRRAFTSRIIIKKLADEAGLKVDTERQALERLKTEGFSQVIVQPLHIEAGDEYEKLKNAVSSYEKDFAKITVGRPVLYYTGQEGEKPDDYLFLIKALQAQLPKLAQGEAVAVMGHGGVHPSNTAYAALQLKLQDAGIHNVFVFTVEGYPTYENLLDKLKEKKIKKVTLMPLMLVAGDHANNDMAGTEDDSFKTQLTKAGFQVAAYLHGLGENPVIQDIYVQHVKDAIENKYNERGKDRPPIPVIH